MAKPVKITTAPRKVISSDVFFILTPAGQTSLFAESYYVEAFIILAHTFTLVTVVQAG